MNDIKRGQRVWIQLENEIKETVVKSAGYKYVTVEYNSDLLFDRRTLRRANSRNSFCCVIVDLEQYKKDQYIKGMIDKIKNFKLELVDKQDLEKIVDILREY